MVHIIMCTSSRASTTIRIAVRNQILHDCCTVRIIIRTHGLVRQWYENEAVIHRDARQTAGNHAATLGTIAQEFNAEYNTINPYGYSYS